jgi:hypothetical protein
MTFNGSIVISRCVISLPPSTPTSAYCTGGTITTSGGKRIHTFTGDGTLVVVNPGNVEMLLVAGGGGSGAGENTASDGGGGGGGAGGVIYNAAEALTAGNKAIVIGAGGAVATVGGNTTFNGNTAAGGGLGRNGTSGAANVGGTGGSGGGGSRGGAGGTASPAGQGNAGGAGVSPAWTGGGGGGKGGAASGITKGAGQSYGISGAAVTYAEGGQGGAGTGMANGVAGAANTGNGASGGAAGAPTGGAGAIGGSGIVIVSYDASGITGGESVDAITLSPRPSLGMIGWRKCSASERAEGGYYRANITMTGPLDYLADFMLNGLMRDVKFFSGSGSQGVQCWEGFIYEMTLNRKTAEIKISMDRVANNVWMRYRVTGSGTTVRSDAQADATSQARYGIRDYVLTGGELENSVVADSKCKQYLALNRQPKPTRSGPGRPDEEYTLEIICRGYFDTLNNQCYNATGGASQGASAEVTTIVAAKGQFVASTEIRSNATPVSEVYDVDRRTGDIIQDIARLGDANPKRWLARMTNNRVFQFVPAAAASATVGSA